MFINTTLLKLNLGCGSDIREGYINVDCESVRNIAYAFKSEGQYLQLDLQSFPWKQFTSNSVDEVLMLHVLEHLPDTISTLKEIHRILKPGGVFVGQVPFCHSSTSFIQFDHVKYFHWHSFKTMEPFGFRCVKAEPGFLTAKNWKMRARRFVPFKRFLSVAINNVYDVVDFRLIKI